MASEQVFDTTELLEMILYKLPTKDLLLAQRVAKQWKAVIDSSINLQRALFFQPIPGDPLPRVETPFCETPYETVKAQASRECVINTLLKDVRRNMRQRLRLKTSTPIRDSMFKDKASDLHHSYQREDASWKRMLLSQPPVHNGMRVICEYLNQRHDYCVGRVLCGDHFPIMDMVLTLEQGMETLDKRPGGSCRLDEAAHLTFGMKLEDNDQLEHLIQQRRLARQRDSKADSLTQN